MVDACGLPRRTIDDDLVRALSSRLGTYTKPRDRAIPAGSTGGILVRKAML